MGIFATLKLLQVSVWLSLSGAFFLMIGFRIIGVSPDYSLCVAFSCVVYSVYTLDRIVGGEEDEVNWSEFNGAEERIPLLLALAAFLAASGVLFYKGVLPAGSVLPFVIGYLYSEGIEFQGHAFRLKGSLGSKNVVVGLSWGLSAAAFLSPWADPSRLLLLSLFLSTKLFINTVVYDCRDVKGDAAAGLRTIPVVLGMRRTRTVLQSLNFVLHGGTGLAVISGLARFPVTILVLSGVFGFTYVSIYCRAGDVPFRNLMVDGEWIHLVIFTEAYRAFSSGL